MTPTIDDAIELPTDLVEEALKLTAAQRKKFAALLLEVKDDPEVVRKEWNVEIKRRIEGYLDGSIPSEDAEVAYQRVVERFRKKYPK